MCCTETDDTSCSCGNGFHYETREITSDEAVVPMFSVNGHLYYDVLKAIKESRVSGSPIYVYSWDYSYSRYVTFGTLSVELD